MAPADDVASTQIAKLGLFEDLVKTLKSLVDSWNVSLESLASNIAATLMALTVRSSSNQSGIRTLGGISTLFALLNLSRNDSTLFWTCAALRNIGAAVTQGFEPLTSTSDTNKNLFFVYLQLDMMKI